MNNNNKDRLEALNDIVELEVSWASAQNAWNTGSEDVAQLGADLNQAAEKFIDALRDMSFSREEQHAFWLNQHAKWAAEAAEWESKWDAHKSKPNTTTADLTVLKDEWDVLSAEYRLWGDEYIARGLAYDAHLDRRHRDPK